MKRTLATLATVASVGLFAGALTLITPEKADAFTLEGLGEAPVEVVAQRVASGSGTWKEEGYTDRFSYTVSSVYYMGVPMNYIVDNTGLAGYLVLNGDGTARYVVDDFSDPITTDGEWEMTRDGKVTFYSNDGSVVASFSNVVAFND